jgi:hypothetical protein
MEKKHRLFKLYQEALNLSFSGYTITEYSEVPTYKLDENESWVDDSIAVFITCKYVGNYLIFSKQTNKIGEKIGEHLESLFGFECNVQIL